METVTEKKNEGKLNALGDANRGKKGGNGLKLTFQFVRYRIYLRYHTKGVESENKNGAPCTIPTFGMYS